MLKQDVSKFKKLLKAKYIEIEMLCALGNVDIVEYSTKKKDKCAELNDKLYEHLLDTLLYVIKN